MVKLENKNINKIIKVVNNEYINNKLKRVNLIIFPGYFLPHMGGLETHVDEFSKYLTKSDKYNNGRSNKYNVSIFAPQIPSNSKKYEVIHGDVQVLRYPAFELISNYPFPKFWKLDFWKMFFSLYKKDCDIVMTRTRFFFNSFLGTFFAKFKLVNRKKLIHVEHGSSFVILDSNFKTKLAYFYDMLFGKLIFLISDKIVAVSQGSKKFVMNNFNIKKKVEVVRRGVNFDLILDVNEDKQLKLKYGSKIIISYAGRLIDGKGIQDVLKVLSQIEYDFVFIIIGDGPYRSKLEKLVFEYNLEKKVEFRGKLKYEKVISILKASDLFVHPSYSEGLPTAVLDAFFSGCKILATNVGGTYEILSKHWNSQRYILVESKNVLDLRKGMISLFKVKKEMDMNLYNEIKKKFDWNEHVSAYDKLMVDLLK
ncbi:MAG: glycosyltransferase family 4 protein [Nanoarchaeota archaeon]|nr:glycosyltransferase family 4 protein [Nanoarchaeota archaeon]